MEPIITLPLRIGQRRNLAPVWIGASIVAIVVAAGIVAVTGMGIAVMAVPAIVGGCAILLGLLQLRRPATLTLDQTGLTFSWLWRASCWNWSEIDGFRVAHVRSGKAIMFEVREDGRSSVAAVPSSFEIDAQDLVAMLRKVRRLATDAR